MYFFLHFYVFAHCVRLHIYVNIVALIPPFLSLTIADTLMLLANTLLLDPPLHKVCGCALFVMDSLFSMGIKIDDRLDRIL